MGYITVMLMMALLVGELSAQLPIKPGDCPPPISFGICSITCGMDDHCTGIKKCCGTACGGTICSRPVTARKPALLADKSGSCPARPPGPWICTSRCAFDGDCRGSKKCCKNRCGAMACTKPDA